MASNEQTHCIGNEKSTFHYSISMVGPRSHLALCRSYVTLQLRAKAEKLRLALLTSLMCTKITSFVSPYQTIAKTKTQTQRKKSCIWFYENCGCWAIKHPLCALYVYKQQPSSRFSHYIVHRCAALRSELPRGPRSWPDRDRIRIEEIEGLSVYCLVFCWFLNLNSAELSSFSFTLSPERQSL